VPYLVGTMIELPRAALTADAIAKEAEFFSFGTKRPHADDVSVSRATTRGPVSCRFYVEHGILKDDPFQVLDQEGRRQNSSRWRSGSVGGRGPSSRSASAGSTAASPRP